MSLIVVHDLTKRFRIYRRPRDRLVEWVSLGHATRHVLFTALEDISFEVSRGECLGVIGPNGAGKSTLLKILSGTLFPSAGYVRVRGSVFPLLQSGLGLYPDLTGEENMRHLWRLWGRRDADLNADTAENIEAFADIGTHFRRPIKHYSAGMCARLFFAIGTAFCPDILIVDEVLAVGDTRFVSKCYDRVRALVAAGCTIIYVSHDLDSVRAFCKSAIWLDGGRIAAQGDSREVVDKYLENVFSDGIAIPGFLLGASTSPSGAPSEGLPLAPLGPPSTLPDPSFDETPGMIRHGDGDFRILNLVLSDAQGRPTSCFRVHDRVVAKILFECVRDHNDDLCVAFAIRSRRGELLIALNTIEERVALPKMKPGDQLEVCFDVDITLAAGEYIVDCSVEHNDRKRIDYCDGRRFARIITVLASIDRRIVYGTVWVPNRTLVTGFAAGRVTTGAAAG